MARKALPGPKRRRHGLIARWQAAIGQHDGAKAIRLLGGQSQADERAPVLTEQGEVTKIQFHQPVGHPTDLGCVAVIRRSRWLVRAPETDQVRGQHPVSRGNQRRDHEAVEIAPGRFTVEQQHRRRVARPFIQVMQAQACHLGVLRLKREVGQRVEALFWGAQNVHEGP